MFQKEKPIEKNYLKVNLPSNVPRKILDEISENETLINVTGPVYVTVNNRKDEKYEPGQNSQNDWSAFLFSQGYRGNNFCSVRFFNKTIHVTQATRDSDICPHICMSIR